MARDTSVSDSTICQKCRCKVTASRSACPRCNTPIAAGDPDREAAKSTRLALIAGTALALALIGLGVVYMQQPVETQSATGTRTVPDPLAARRAASTAAVPAAQTSEAAPADPAGADTGFASGDGARLLDQYRDVVRRRPEDADAHASLGQLLVRLKRTEEAVPEFERAVTLDPQRPAHQLSLGRAFAELHRWPDAVESLRRAQHLQPADAATTYELARALHRKGTPTAAVEEYRKVIGLDPNDASVRIALAESYEALDRRTEATAAYQEYLQLAPSGADADRVRLKLSRLTNPSEPGAPVAGDRVP